MALAECLEPGAQRRIKADLDTAAGRVLAHRTRPVRGQHQQGRRPFQGLLPVSALARQHLATQPLALPDGKIAVLHRQRRQRIGLATAERGVKLRQLAGQHIHRPAIGDDVVQGQQQYLMVLGEDHSSASDQWPVRQIERSPRLIADQGCQVHLWPLAQVLDRQWQAALDRRNQHVRDVIVFDKTIAQGFVTGDDTLQCPLQGDVIQTPAQAQGDGDVVGGTGTFQLSQEP